MEEYPWLPRHPHSITNKNKNYNRQFSNNKNQQQQQLLRGQQSKPQAKNFNRFLKNKNFNRNQPQQSINNINTTNNNAPLEQFKQSIQQLQQHPSNQFYFNSNPNNNQFNSNYQMQQQQQQQPQAQPQESTSNIFASFFQSPAQQNITNVRYRQIKC